MGHEISHHYTHLFINHKTSAFATEHYTYHFIQFPFSFSSEEMNKILHLVFGVFGNATGLFLFLAPTITFKRIVMKRSTEKFSGIPYVMTLLNCLLSAWYGLPFISPNNILVTVINGTGAAIESVYVMIFLIFAPKKEKAKVFALLVAILAVFATVAFVSLLAFHDLQKKKVFCGFAAAIFSIIMYASPLSIMRMVIKTKSVEFMPFFLSLFVFLCGTSWFIYGLIGKDPFLAVPNGFGCGLGTIQLILYSIYRGNKGETKRPKEDESVEMGLSKPKQ
uniref:Bidirectional sugar transporter SWEET n=1 Tax=Jasminum sambac TaxID=660624 RepID=A0A6G6FSN5_9LAMI|nr:sugar transporter SWEET1 [Jasminum sambac]